VDTGRAGFLTAVGLAAGGYAHRREEAVITYQLLGSLYIPVLAVKMYISGLGYYTYSTHTLPQSALHQMQSCFMVVLAHE
jgi:hypothetical protein